MAISIGPRRNANPTPRRKRTGGADVFLAAENRAKDVDVGGEPEFDFVARLPEQVDTGANHERADDSEKLGHGYRPRPAVREKYWGEGRWAPCERFASSGVGTGAGMEMGFGAATSLVCFHVCTIRWITVMLGPMARIQRTGGIRL